ncbi:MAG: ATP-binding protein [Gammaproteobacteria bacterium]|nr:ATP-binding protein [Gammaproteobacteria bacterium]
MPEDENLSSALANTSESDDIDFKSSFDASSLRDWLEILKDIAAFANSGGGYILIGLNNDGTPSNSDISGLLAVDPADLGNRIHKHTGQHFSGVQLIGCEKSGHRICAIRVLPVHVILPCSFGHSANRVISKPEVNNENQKRRNNGTVCLQEVYVAF